jgi:hypothetical protein
MKLELYPDFNHTWKVGDRLIVEQTVIGVNGAPALITTDIILVPAGSKKGRPIVFADGDPPRLLDNIKIDERGK